jgi:hypothetical protein
LLDVAHGAFLYKRLELLYRPEAPSTLISEAPPKAPSKTIVRIALQTIGKPELIDGKRYIP